MQPVSISGSMSADVSALRPTNLKVRYREAQKSRQQSRANASLRAAGHRRKKRSGMKRRIWAGQYSIWESYVNPDLSRTTKAILEVVNARAPCASCSPGFVTRAGSTFYPRRVVKTLRTMKGLFSICQGRRQLFLK